MFELPEDEFFAQHGITLEQAEREAEFKAWEAENDFPEDPERFLSEHDLVPAMTVDLEEVADLNALAEAQSEAAWEYLAGMDHYPW